MFTLVYASQTAKAPVFSFLLPSNWLWFVFLKQSSDESDEDDASPRMSPKRRIISFSIHNSVAKPTVAPNCPKVTSRMDIVGSRKPYGHWVQVRTTGKISLSR
jgi:hypothetical protein